MKQLILVGGGHSHAIALLQLIHASRRKGQFALPNTQITLVSNVQKTPYSGMLPGHVAGYYTEEEIHIDLVALAQQAQIQFCRDECVGLDLNEQTILCRHHSPLRFDCLSLDIGSTPALATIEGAQTYSIPAKPVPQFLQGWNQLLTQPPVSPFHLGIIGGGAGGVELALNMNHRLHQTFPNQTITLHLFHRQSTLLPHHAPWVSQRLHQLLTEAGIRLHLGETVTAVQSEEIICQSGFRQPCQAIFLVTQATAPPWLKASGIATDERGFVRVNQCLQSVSHPQLFATGDIATIDHFPRPKAGVFAVRQGKPLFRNWQRWLAGKPLKPYYPQSTYLALIGTGDQNAIASWGNWGFQSPLLWRLKDKIDRDFMTPFRDRQQ